MSIYHVTYNIILGQGSTCRWLHGPESTTSSSQGDQQEIWNWPRELQKGILEKEILLLSVWERGKLEVFKEWNAVLYRITNHSLCDVTQQIGEQYDIAQPKICQTTLNRTVIQ